MSLGDRDFRFWTEPEELRHRIRCADLGLCGPATGPWKSAAAVAEEEEEEDARSSSPLLPHGHRYCNRFGSSRSAAIEQGRREMMEMVRNMPESSFELSLRDMVDEKQQQQSWTESFKEDDSVGEVVDEKENGKKSRKKARSSAVRKDQRQVLRTGSMDSGSLMIKMFVPAFLCTSRKDSSKGGRSRSMSKVSPRTSMDGTENRDDCCESWCRRAMDSADQRIQLSSKSGSRRRSSSCRECKGGPIPSCWPFDIVKGKMRRQSTCNF